MSHPICPRCGKPDSEVFVAGDGELGSRTVSHIECVVALEAANAELRRERDRMSVCGACRNLELGHADAVELGGDGLCMYHETHGPRPTMRRDSLCHFDPSCFEPLRAAPSPTPTQSQVRRIALQSDDGKRHPACGCPIGSKTCAYQNPSPDAQVSTLSGSKGSLRVGPDAKEA